MGEYSKVVADGMKRVCGDFTKIVHPLGFRRGSGRKWIRRHENGEDRVHLIRQGATYGAPGSASITLHIELISHRNADGATARLSRHTTKYLRRHTGYCYHHRFNSETWSTYDRCVEELALFMEEVAEPWFESEREWKR